MVNNGAYQYFKLTIPAFVTNLDVRNLQKSLVVQNWLTFISYC